MGSLWLWSSHMLSSLVRRLSLTVFLVQKLGTFQGLALDHSHRGPKYERIRNSLVDRIEGKDSVLQETLAQIPVS